MKTQRKFTMILTLGLCLRQHPMEAAVGGLSMEDAVTAETTSEIYLVNFICNHVQDPHHQEFHQDQVRSF